MTPITNEEKLGHVANLLGLVHRFRSLSTSTDGGVSQSSNPRSPWTKPPPGRLLLKSRRPRPPLMPVATTRLAPPSQVDQDIGSESPAGGAQSKE